MRPRSPGRQRFVSALLSAPPGLSCPFAHPGHVGVELHLLTDQALDSTSSAMPSWTRLAPPGVAHAVGGRRLRVLRSSCAQPGELWRQATVEPLHDDIVTERRRERSRERLQRPVLQRGPRRQRDVASRARGGRRRLLRRHRRALAQPGCVFFFRFIFIFFHFHFHFFSFEHGKKIHNFTLFNLLFKKMAETRPASSQVTGPGLGGVRRPRRARPRSRPRSRGGVSRAPDRPELSSVRGHDRLFARVSLAGASGFCHTRSPVYRHSRRPFLRPTFERSTDLSTDVDFVCDELEFYAWCWRVVETSLFGHL